MVLKAVDVNYQEGDNQKKSKFLEYIPHVWGLSEKYANKIKLIPSLKDTPIRIIEMALWMKGRE